MYLVQYMGHFLYLIQNDWMVQDSIRLPGKLFPQQSRPFGKFQEQIRTEEVIYEAF